LEGLCQELDLQRENFRLSKDHFFDLMETQFTADPMETWKILRALGFEMSKLSSY
jgi:hypothetical protein